MSVQKWKRKPSGVQFIDTAVELHQESLRLYAALPKASRISVGQPIVHSAEEIMRATMRANRSRDVRYRLDVLSSALAETDVLEQLTINALNIYSFNSPTFTGETIGDIAVLKIGRLLGDSRKLISGVISSDRKRLVSEGGIRTGILC